MKTIASSFFAASLLLLASCHKDKESFFGSVKAHDFLSEKRYTRLIVEVCYVDGYRPSQSAMDQLQAFLYSRLHKSSGITIEQRPIPAPGYGAYTLHDLKEAEKNNRSRWTADHTLTAYVFFAEGDYADDPRVLGVAYGPTSLAIFEHKVKAVSGGIGQPPQSVLETTVAEHEFGHLLGLVDNGSNMMDYHLDASHGKHCSVQGCLMYYAVETTDIVSNLLGGNVPQLDQHCLDDLRDNGGK